MKKILFFTLTFITSLFFLVLSPKTAFAYPNGCNGPNGKTGTCYGQITCNGISPTLCCDTQTECDAAINNPTYINCTASSIPQCLASQPIGCIKSGTYCCATNDDCTRLGGTVDATRSHFKETSSSVTCPNNPNGIETAIGCIPVLGTNGTTDFLTFILRWAMGIGGGIAFLLILYAGFMIMTSAGNPERLKAGQELLTSAISGLILLIFSVVILKFIGVDILGLCNFGFGGSCPK